MRLWRALLHNWFTLQCGPAHRVIFYYYGEDPTYLDEVFVTVFRNGMVEVEHRNEHVSTHIQNVEILWKGRASHPTMATGRSLTLVKPEVNSNSPDTRL